VAVHDEARRQGLPGGWYLVGAGPAAAGSETTVVRDSVHRLMENIRGEEPG